MRLYTIGLHAQSYNSDRVAFTNFLVRMYMHAPFEGVRVVNDYDNAYLTKVPPPLKTLTFLIHLYLSFPISIDF